MSRMSVCFLQVLLLLAASGCSGSLVREGVWELSYRGLLLQTGQSVPIRTRHVQVLVEANPDGSGEVAEISPIPGSPAGGKVAAGEGAKDTIDVDPAKEMRPLYADIQVKREGEPPIITIHHTDAFWTFRMWGEVRTPEYIVGTKFGARHREKNVSMEGYWFMKWLRDI